MLRATLKSLLSRKLRLILSGLAVVLGVMFVSGAFVLTDTLARSFDNLFATVYQQTDVAVTAKPKVQIAEMDGEAVPGLLPADTLDAVRQTPGVGTAIGVVSVDGARVIGSNGKVVTSYGPPRLGGNWTGDDAYAQIRDGRAPSADNEIVVNAALAKTAGIKVGDQVGVLTRQPKQTFTLVGVYVYSGGRETLGGVQEVLFSTPVAQRLMLGESNVYTSIDVRTGPGVTDEALRDALAARLGGDVVVRTNAELQKAITDEFREGLKFFNYILLGFAGVALFVGIFLILNTFSIIVAQRTRELALLRAVGASRRQMIGSVLVEAIVIGVLASVLGLAAGIGVGVGLAWLFGQLGSGIELAGVGIPISAVIGAFSVGIVITVVAALLPAVRAARIPPIAALQEAATPDRPLTKVTVAGALVGAVGGTLLGLGLAGTGDGSTTLWLILSGVLVSFIGVALLTPLLSRPLVGVLGRLFSWSVPGKLGRLNSGRNPRRTAITAAALMVGLALITGVNVIIASMTASFHKLADEQVRIDLIISGEGANGMPATFDPAVLDRVRQLDGVREVVGEYYDTGTVNARRTGVSAITDLPSYARMLSLEPVAGGPFTPLADGELAVDADRAKDFGVGLGDRVRVQLSRGEERTFTIVSVYQDRNVGGGWLMNDSVVADFRTPQPIMGDIVLADGASVDGVRQQFDRLLVDNPEVTVADRSAYVEQQMSQTDSLVTMVQILLALAILIAVLGIINTLALSVLERTRELGLLRAIGLRRAQTMRMITVEAVVISVFGALLGLGVGTGLGAAVIRALRDQGFTEFALPWGSMGLYLGLAALVGVVAAVLPAIRAARVNILAAIAHE